MPKPPGGAPPFKPHRVAYHELLTNLWYAHDRFRSKGDGGKEGAQIACRAVERFIGVRHENPELAAAFRALYKAFEDLESGIEPELFATDPSPKARSRSSQRKHVQLIAAVAMEVLMDLGMPKDEAASLVARKTTKWSQLPSQEITDTTIKNWRDVCRSERDPRKCRFFQIKQHILELPDPREEVNRLLTEGPPGIPGA